MCLLRHLHTFIHNYSSRCSNRWYYLNSSGEEIREFTRLSYNDLSTTKGIKEEIHFVNANLYNYYLTSLEGWAMP